MRPLEVLLVEDNPGDMLLVKEAVKQDASSMNLVFVKDGLEAVAYLKRDAKFEGAPRPDLILLDLNLPLKDGREVLAEIKSDLALRSIPVVVFTSSRADSDIQTAYDLHANCYITKPSDLTEYMNTIQGIKEFWINIAELPGRK